MLLHAGTALLFLLYKFDFTAGGALAALILGLVTNLLWSRGTNLLGVQRSMLTLGPNSRWAHDIEHVVGAFWRLVAQPLLFAIIGTLVDFRSLNAEMIPKSLAVIVIGRCSCYQAAFLAPAWAACCGPQSCTEPRACVV